MERPLKNHVLEGLFYRLGGQSLSFPHPVPELRAVETHISTVLLAGEFVYKIKKPVTFPFVDYSTLEKRRVFCQAEVDLNRRLAEEVYLGVVPLTLKGNVIEVEGRGEPVEYAVKMRRLPDIQRLGSLLEKSLLKRDFWTLLAYRLTRYYRNAPRGLEVSKWATPKAVEEDLRQVLFQVRSFPSEILLPQLQDRLEILSLEGLEAQKGRIEKRKEGARDGHGDLRLEHIYYFPPGSRPTSRETSLGSAGVGDEVSNGPQPPDSRPSSRETSFGSAGAGDEVPKDPWPKNIEEQALVVIDCVEFNPRYRCADPLSDIAFLVMDLEASGFREEAKNFTEAFLRTSGELTTDHLLDFYVAYRHLVRGLVRGLQAQDPKGDPQRMEEAKKKARRHFLMALGRLETPQHRPCLVVLAGLPGTGKSTLAEQLSKTDGLQVFSSDLTRKELAGHPLGSAPATGFETGIYHPDWTEKTYATLLDRARLALRRGERALVDASFLRESNRETFLKLSQELGVPFLFFVCLPSAETIHQRLAETRKYGSDADIQIYRKMAERWERPSPDLNSLFLNTDHPLETSLAEIHQVLVEQGLAQNDVLNPLAGKT